MFLLYHYYRVGGPPNSYILLSDYLRKWVIRTFSGAVGIHGGMGIHGDT